MNLVAVFVAAILTAGLSTCSVKAQTVETTPNLIRSGASSWTGTTNSTTVGGGYSGGSSPAYNASNNIVYFGYTTSTVAQTIAINNALQGSGVQVGGYNYSWMYLNNSSTGGTLSSTIKLTSPAGTTLEQYNYAMNQVQDGWRTVQGSQNFNQQYGLADVGNLSISFTGKDARFWAGYYGPQLKDVNLSLKYTVDPCVSNPLYATTCAGYNNVITSQNITATSYAINQALNLSGAGVQINGFQYGYDVSVGGQWCSGGFIICWQYSPSSMGVDVNVTNNAGTNLYSASHEHTTQNTTGSFSYSYVFPQQKLLSSMGNFSMTTRQNGTGAVYNQWSNWQYTPDPCVANPLSSTSCSGYQQAYTEQQCASNPLYSTQCSGYAAARFTQQCSANQLSDPGCPGYAAAYLTQQCNANPLYSTTCSGYDQAYLNQQCGISPLYSRSCSGYSRAYHDQQCSIDPLYATDCVGYTTAYHDQQCSANPLYATDCVGYASAYLNQQCTANPLYSTQCSGYAVAYKNQQCSLNPLYATDCTGYTAAYHNQQCTANPLYMTDCAGYQAAYFAQQCNLNGLYDRSCPNYSTAYATKMLLEQQGTASIVATAGVIAQNAPTTTTTTVSNDGTVSSPTTVSSTGSATVDKAIAAPPPTANSAAAPAAVVQLAPPPPPAAGPQAPQQAKNDGPNGDRKPEGGQDRQGGPQTQMSQGQQSGGDKPPQPTAREALAERRQAAAKAEAVEKGKNLANEMGKAADMESQKQVQNVVIQAMGFTPGFDNYNKTIIPDTKFYRPYSVYNNQKNIDNRANQRMWTGTDRLHNEMVDSQYNKGN